MNRRSFVKTGGSLASALTLLGAGSILPACNGARNLNGRNNEYGLQLYSLRDVMPADPKGVLQQIASFGYRQIEGYEGSKGMFWGMKNTEFKNYLDELGLKFISSHCGYKENFEQKADQAAEIGMKYLICPWIGPQKDIDSYKIIAKSFNKAGEVCRSRGLKFAYHNHDYSFKSHNGLFPQDVLMQTTDPSLVDYEMDIYWVVAAGQTPEEWFSRYPGRFKLGHVKDRKGAKSATLGTGNISYSSILKQAQKAGMNYFIVEQEEYENTTPLDAVRDNAKYMQSLKV